MQCAGCGTQNYDGVMNCANCGRTLPPPLPPPPLGEDGGIRALLPVGRSGLAIAAGYVGLLAILVIPAPVALFLGILAVRDIRAHPRKHGMGRAVFAIIMGILFSIPLLLLLLALLTG